MSGLTKGNWIAYQNDAQKIHHVAGERWTVALENRSIYTHGCGPDDSYMAMSGLCSEADALAMAAAPEMLEALLQCRAQFDFYAHEHRKAGKHDKARTNETFAFLCSQAIIKATEKNP